MAEGASASHSPQLPECLRAWHCRLPSFLLLALPLRVRGHYNSWKSWEQQAVKGRVENTLLVSFFFSVKRRRQAAHRTGAETRAREHERQEGEKRTGVGDGGMRHGRHGGIGC